MDKKEALRSFDRAKLFRPPVTADHRRRDALEARIRDAAEQHIIVVAAPAGYGKTSLISHWIEVQGLPCTWITLDLGDNELSALLPSVASGLQEWCPEATKQLNRMIHSPRLPPPSQLAAMICGEISRTKIESVLVLDDYHRIHDEEVHQFVASLMEYLPVNLRLAVVSRKNPPLPLGRLRSQNRVLDVRLKDLRFDLQETKSLVESAAGLSVDEAVSQQLLDVTEGWPAGLRMLLLAIESSGDILRYLKEFDGNIWQIQEYLIEEVLDQLSPDLTAAILRTAILGRLHADLCDVVIAGDNNHEITGRQLVEQVRQRNLFCISMDGAGNWYRYHQLFRDLLLDRLRTVISEREIRELELRAARWFDEHAYPEDAVVHYLRGGDVQAAAESANRHGLAMADELDWKRLDRLLRRLPVHLFDSDVGLMLLLARASDKLGRIVEMIELVYQADEECDRRRAAGECDDLLHGQICALRSIIEWHFGNTQLALDLSREALELLPREFAFDRGYALLTEGVALQSLGKSADSKEALNRALARLDHESTGTQVGIGLSVVHWANGELDALIQFATGLLESGVRKGYDESAAHAQWFIAAAHYYLGDLDASDSMARVIAEDRWTPSFMPHVMAAVVLARCHQARGETQTALSVIEDLLEDCLGANSANYLQVAQAAQAALRFETEDKTGAGQWAASFEIGDPTAGYMFIYPALVAIRIRIDSASGSELEELDGILARHADFYVATHNTRYLIETLALRALCNDKAGNSELGGGFMLESVLLAEPGGFLRLFVDLGADLVPLLSRLEVKGQQLEYVGRILGEFRDAGGPGRKPNGDQLAARNREIAGLPEQLTKREQEVLGLLAKHLTNKEIGEKLFISPATVKRHAHNIYEKLNVADRREAIAKSKGLGLVEL